MSVCEDRRKKRKGSGGCQTVKVTSTITVPDVRQKVSGLTTSKPSQDVVCGEGDDRLEDAIVFFERTQGTQPSLMSAEEGIVIGSDEGVAVIERPLDDLEERDEVALAVTHVIRREDRRRNGRCRGKEEEEEEDKSD